MGNQTYQGLKHKHMEIFKKDFRKEIWTKYAHEDWENIGGYYGFWTINLLLSIAMIPLLPTWFNMMWVTPLSVILLEIKEKTWKQ